MTILQAILLGIVQGLTEFLPVSSSAHLVLVPFFLNWTLPAEQVFVFDVLVQLGTLVAVIVFFWKDLWGIVQAWVKALLARKPFGDPQARMGWYLILATIPAGLLGVLIKDTVEAAFHSALAVGGFLIVTAALLYIAEWLGKRSRKLEEMTWKDALVMGIGQAGAIFPGVSRSGATITAGMLRGLDRPAAARFSFLMSVPVMLAAGVLSIFDVAEMPGLSAFLPSLVVGFISAAVVGYFAIRWLLGYLVRHSLKGFAIYCAALGLLTIVVSLVK